MKPLPLSAYGLLLTFDGYGADAARCTDEQLLLKVLRELPALIQMRRLGEPHLVRVDEPGIAGLSGFTFIMESHISIHTYAERGFVTADVYSCKSFDTEIAERYLRNVFEITHAETHSLPRGLQFRDPSRPVP